MPNMMRVLSLKDLLSFYNFRVMVYAQIRYFCILDIVEGSFYVSFSRKEVGPGTPQNGLQSTILLLLGCAQTLSPSPREDVAK